MSLLLLSLLSSNADAGAGVGVSTVPAADLVFHGEVVSTSQCQSPGGVLWTFATFEVLDTIIGTAVPSSTELPDRFTVRLPFGVDGATGDTSGMHGAPILQEGDQLILPVFSHTGALVPLPIFLTGTGAYQRVFEHESSTVVVGADGRILQDTSSGFPTPGAKIIPGMAGHHRGNAPINATELEQALDTYDTLVAYDGVSPPAGEWVGRARLRLSQPVTFTSTGDDVDFTGTCSARIAGSYDGTTLTGEGWCNAPRAGAIRIQVSGTFDPGEGWSGSLVAQSPAETGVGLGVSWDDGAWKATYWYPDGFVARGDDATILGSIPSEAESFMLNESPADGVAVMMVFDGPRRPMSADDYKAWIAQQATAKGNAGRVVSSTPNTAANCTDMEAL